jgi:hypothetical protein
MVRICGHILSLAQKIRSWQMCSLKEMHSLYDPILRRDEAAQYLREVHYIPCEPGTLAYYAWVGNGPAFYKAGKFPLYPREELDAWAKKRLGCLVRSNREARKLKLARYQVPTQNRDDGAAGSKS